MASYLIGSLFVPVFTATACVLFVYALVIIKKILEASKEKNKAEPNSERLKQSLPITVSTSWKLRDPINGLMIWENCMFSSEANIGIIACQAVIQATSEIVIKELSQSRILQLVHPLIDCVSVAPATVKSKQPENPDISSDTVLVEIKTPNSSSSVINNYFRWKNSLCLKRQWKNTKGSASWLFIAPEVKLYEKLFGTWQCFVAQDIPDEGSSSNICLLCLFAAPCDNSSMPLLKQSISSQVVYFREHIDSIYLKKIFRKDAIKQHSNSLQKANEGTAKTAVPTKDDKLTQVQSPKRSFAGREEKGFVEMPAEISRIPKMQLSKEEQTPVKDNQISNEKVNAYKDVIAQALELLVEIYEADESTDGWSYIGNRNGVEVYRMQGDVTCPSDCFKGTSQAKVPISYALQYCMNLEYKKEWDDVFNEGQVIEDLDEVTKVTYMEYKPVWPTTARDFCSIVATRHIKGNTYAMAAKAITHPSCPPRKGKQRAEIIAGGFVIEGITDDPPLCKVTYITRADLKGKIPAGLVNKVNEKQPMYAGVVRDKVEERYMYQDPPSEGNVKILAARKYPSLLETSLPILGADAEASDDDKNKIDSQAEIKSPGSEGQIRELTGDEVNELIPENDAQWDTMSETSVTSFGQNEDSESEWQGDARPICEQSIELPRDALGNVDHMVLGNQAAAKLLEEILLASDVNSKSKPPENSEVLETWTYQGTMRNVVVLRKIHRDSSFYSFLGRGVIEVLPVTVWEAVKNPSTRFVYDNMLKRTKVVKEISDSVKIIHMRHETTACFVKQARDFVILVNERMDDQKYVVAGLSVDIPECPLERNCIRGKVLASGWTIEPVLIKGKLCSLVTYLSQVDFGGRLPIRLINLIAKRQPMSIAYLRTYLESAEVKS